MEKLLEILEDIQPGIDYANRTDLVTGGCLKSFEILSLVSEIEEEYDVEIDVEDVVPENFESASAILALIERSK